MSLDKSTERFMVYPTIVYLSCHDMCDKYNNRESNHGSCFVINQIASTNLDGH